MTTTIDGLLNHRITIEQPKKGYRVAIDTLLLAAAVPAKVHDTVLELGCGVGGAMLALACRVSEIAVTGIELQPELAKLCLSNIERNALKAKLKVINCYADDLPHDLHEAFDHVMMNPPYHDAARHTSSPLRGKRLANSETDGDLRRWAVSASKALKTGGVLTLIHRMDRLDAVIGVMEPSIGGFIVKPVVTRPDMPAKRVLVRAVKGAAPVRTILGPLVMHEAEGRYTATADAILRDAEAIDFS